MGGPKRSKFCLRKYWMPPYKMSLMKVAWNVSRVKNIWYPYIFFSSRRTWINSSLCCINLYLGYQILSAFWSLASLAARWCNPVLGLLENRSQSDACITLEVKDGWALVAVTWNLYSRPVWNSKTYSYGHALQFMYE